MAYRDDVIWDLKGLHECGVITDEQLQTVITWLDSQAAEKTLQELEEGGCMVIDATELCIFKAGMH